MRFFHNLFQYSENQAGCSPEFSYPTGKSVNLTILTKVSTADFPPMQRN